jgi:serine/threonine protein phosphatase PrpC
VANGRVNGNLSLSRALGDHYYKLRPEQPSNLQPIICHPDVKEFDRPNNGFIVMGCDGIWERFESSSAGLL